MRSVKNIFSIIIGILLAACASQKSISTSASGRYSEDLTVWRPKIDPPKDTVIEKQSDNRKTARYVEPKYAVNKRLDPILDSISRINLSRKFVDGFTIQVYSGKREDALNIKRQLFTLAPEVVSEVQFTEPVFRVKAGKYYSWLDAQKDYSVIKKHFPAAIIIPDKIAIN